MIKFARKHPIATVYTSAACCGVLAALIEGTVTGALVVASTFLFLAALALGAKHVADS